MHNFNCTSFDIKYVCLSNIYQKYSIECESLVTVSDMFTHIQLKTFSEKKINFCFLSTLSQRFQLYKVYIQGGMLRVYSCWFFLQNK